MSTYLELVNLVLDRLNEVNLDSTTFASARGIHSAAKQGVRNAVNQINTQKWEWPFNYASSTKVLTTGTNIYSFEADYKIADWESFYIQIRTGLGPFVLQKTHHLWPIQRQQWYKYGRQRDLDNTTDGLTLPKQVFQGTAGNFGVTPVPDTPEPTTDNAVYIVTYNYWIKTTELSSYSDSTTIPENFNWIITLGALEDMYMFLDNDQRAGVTMGMFKKAIDQMATILIPQNIADFRGTQVNFGGQQYFGGFGRASDPMI